MRVEMPGNAGAREERSPCSPWSARGDRRRGASAIRIPRRARSPSASGDPSGCCSSMIVRRGDRALVAFLDRVPARADGRRARDEAFDVGALGARVIGRDPAGVVRRPRELDRSRLDLRFRGARRPGTAARGRRSSRRDSSRSCGTGRRSSSRCRLRSASAAPRSRRCSPSRLPGAVVSGSIFACTLAK